LQFGPATARVGPLIAHVNNMAIATIFNTENIVDFILELSFFSL